MLDKLIHVNSKGNVLDFNALGIYANYNDLRDFAFEVTTTNNSITSIKSTKVDKTIPLVFWCDKSKANEIKNMVTNHFDIDRLNMNQGYFLINGYRLYGYVTKSVKSQYLVNKRLLYLSLTYTCNNSIWVRYNEKSFVKNTLLDELQDGGKKYNYTYSYKYGISSGYDRIYNSTLSDCDFELKIYGAVVNPSITIDGNLYNVNHTINDDEYVVINSKSRTIYLIDRTGKKQSIFDKRNKDSYIFKKIKSGSNAITWSGGFGFDLTLFEERNEPEWN